MMVIPFALLLCARNAMFGTRLVFAGLTAFGLLGLALTFDRVYYITTAVQIGLVFLITVRDRMIKREEAVLVVLVGLALAGFAAPKLYEQFTVREDSISVRLLQYEAAGRMILDHPFLGVGLNNGTTDKPQYVNVTYNKRDPNTQFYLEPTHNVYLSMASEVGVPATLLFCLFFAVATLEAWRQSRGSPDPVVRLGANALFVVFIGVAVNGLMDPFAEYSVVSLLWLYAGISFNLAEMARPPEKPTPVVQPGPSPSCP